MKIMKVINIMNLAKTPKERKRIVHELIDSGKAIYIGRFNASYNLEESPLANNYNVTTYGRKEAIRLYKVDLEGDQDKLNKLRELRGKDLICWCKPNPCHGDVLVELIRKKRGKKQRCRLKNI